LTFQFGGASAYQPKFLGETAFLNESGNLLNWERLYYGSGQGRELLKSYDRSGQEAKATISRGKDSNMQAVCTLTSQRNLPLQLSKEELRTPSMAPQTKMKSSPLPDDNENKENKEEKKATLSVVGKKIPAELSQQLRKLAHDLSNSMETVMQASYLLGQSSLDENNKKWLALIDQASRDAARINRELRELLRAHSE
jgi:hypothetical protein